MIKKLVAQKKLLPTTAEKILALGRKDQLALLSFIKTFCLSLSYSREFIGYLLDISKRDNVAVSELLQSREVVSLAEKVGLPHARKMELLREILRGMRYPERPHPLYGETPTLVGEGVRAKKLTYARQKGTWLKRCPGTLGHICCNYLVINSISGCPFDCTYCYLHTYLNRPGITVFTNLDDLIRELKEFFQKNGNLYFRVGTGEFSDSLALDKETGQSKPLIELFAAQENHLLELKTKSAEVDHLLDLDHKGKTVFAWSVNPQKIVHSEELGAVSLSKRIEAAKKCVDAGYKVGFHFDPIIHYSDWDRDYREVIDSIFSEIDPKEIAWISLGALRYQPELKDIMEKRFPHSRITLGQLDAGEDKKMRYFKPIRIEIFQKMHGFIRFHSKDVYVYLCMESTEVWLKSGIRNQKSNAFAKYFSFFKKT